VALPRPSPCTKARTSCPCGQGDGKHIAFASDRYGNFDVFVMPAEGGPAQRLTYHSSNDFPSDFSVDNQHVLFSSARLDDVGYAQNPNRTLPELYTVPVAGGREKMVLTVPAENARYDATGKLIVFHDRKGYEDPFRKHHTSSIARDIWVHDTEKGTYTQLTDFPGEDRNPLFSPVDNNIYFLSESSGSSNIHRFLLENPGETSQVTKLTNHPVRFLTMANDGKLCFSYDGEIYTMRAGAEPEKVPIKTAIDTRTADTETVSISGGATEMALSPMERRWPLCSVARCS
jgi:tricorn protease